MNIKEILHDATICNRHISNIIIHCSATPAGRHVTTSEIRHWHIRDRKFADIGYHYVILLDGTIEAGRPLNRIGAHCRGKNACSIGICYVGGLDSKGRPADTRTPEQKASLRALLLALRKVFAGADINGHRDFAAKACPCFDATAEYRDLH